MQIEVIDVDKRTHKVELRVNGEPASWLYIRDFNVRIGTQEVFLGGIAGVYTKKEHRMKGYASRVLNHAISWMKEKSYPLSGLFGISHFYHRFGYAVFMGEHRLSILVKNAEEAKCHHTIEEFDETNKEHRDAIVDIYNENNATRSGTVVRKKEEWKGFPKGISWEHKPVSYIVKDGDEIVGYFACERWQFGDTMSIAEIGAKNYDYRVFESIMAFLVKRAIDGRFAYLEFYVPFDHEFADFALRYGYLLRVDYPKVAHGMARIIDLERLFHVIRPELERRLKVANIRRNVTLNISTDIGNVSLKIDGDTVEVLEKQASGYDFKISQASLTQLIFGYRSVKDVVYDSVKVDSEAIPILNALFPKGVPYVWQPDRW
ncbi:MAG: hypothetical protein DRJ66_03115 [Thermoprotei archaeon]|nr:MAG: hypothetical protein DRJ66_03115 [Thermoprotei archaeon]